MTCLSNATVENMKNFAYQIGEHCIGSAVGGAVLAGAATVLEISIFAANPIGAAALCATVAIADCLVLKSLYYIASKDIFPENREVKHQLIMLVNKICMAVKMAIWLTAASFAASYMGVPLIAGAFIVVGATLTLEAILAAKAWYINRKPVEVERDSAVLTNVQNDEESSSSSVK